MTDGVGPQRADDRRGWLVFEHLPDELQRAEDATQAADFDRRTWHHPGWIREFDHLRGISVRCFYRPATPAERTLLAHLGHTLPTNLDTRVEYLSETLRQRRWPALESQRGSAS
jgi:hypothetical protein